METHCNVQRRLYDYQFSLTQTPAEFEQVHQAFLHTYNTTAHQGRFCQVVEAEALIRPSECLSPVLLVL